MLSVKAKPIAVRQRRAGRPLLSIWTSKILDLTGYVSAGLDSGAVDGTGVPVLTVGCLWREEEKPGPPCAGHSLFKPAPTAGLSPLLSWGQLGEKVFRRDENFTEGEGRNRKSKKQQSKCQSERMRRRRWGWGEDALVFVFVSHYPTFL